MGLGLVLGLGLGEGVGVGGGLLLGVGRGLGEGECVGPWEGRALWLTVASTGARSTTNALHWQLDVIASLW